MTPAQHLLYIGSYAAADQPAIYAFTFDLATGNLTARGSFTGIANPSFIAVHPSGRWLYAVSEMKAHSGTAGAVWAFSLAGAPDSLQPINHQASGGDWPCHLAIDATGGWLLVSNYGSGTVGVLPIRADGALGDMTDLIQHHGHGPHPERQEGAHAHSALFAPDHRFAIVADLGMDELLVYAFDRSAGRLREHAHANTRPAAGPRHMTFHPSGQHLYVANELDNTVAVYAYDAVTGRLRERQIVETLPPSVSENTVADIHIAPAGDRVYVSNRGHDSVAVFDIAVDGRLERVAIRPSGGRWPRNFAIAPGGGFLLVANQHSDEVSVMAVLGGADALGAPIAHAAVPGASCVQFVATAP
jgi:6-phosphogluconolactonase